MIDIRSLFGLFGKKRSIGCDLGALCLKAVKLEKIEGGVSLVSKAMLKIPDTLSSDERGRQIQSFFKKNSLSIDGPVSVNIEDPTLLIRRMDLPRMPERDTKTAISWNFREFVEGSIENCIVNYLPIEGMSEIGEKMPITAFCIARRAVEERQSLMRKAGLKASSIEPNATALLAAFNHCYRRERDKYYVISDLGDSVSNFVVIGNGCLLFSRPLAHLSGRKLMENTSKTLVAEKEKAADTVSDFISKLIIEIQRSIDAFCIMYKKERIDKIYLCGGGICLPDIVSRLSSGLGVEVEFFNPFENILHAETAVKLDTAPMYAVAVGLALPEV